MKENEVFRIEIPVSLDVDAAAKRMRTGRMGDKLGDMAVEIGEMARKLAHPRGIYQVSRARVIDNVTMDIDGKTFKGKVINKLLRDQPTVYPFIVTIGKELDELPISPKEMMKNFCLDTIKTMVLVNAVEYLAEHIKKTHNIPRAALLNPGEIEDWTITEQRPLFSLFKDVERLIGVSLTAGGVMKPIKSRSGIVFPNDTGFQSCQLCTQFQCPGRRAKFDPELQKQYLA